MKPGLVMWLGCVAAACGASPPAAPTGPAQAAGPAAVDFTPVSKPLSLSPGKYWLQIYGHALSDNPAEPVCAPPGVPAQGTFVNALVRVEQSLAGWVALSAPGEGTIEFRFAQAGVAAGRGETVSGTVRGMGRDSPAGTFRPATNVSVTLRGLPEETAAVRGVASAGAVFLYGDITGRVAFSDPSGASSSCRLVYWTLQPVNDAAGQ